MGRHWRYHATQEQVAALEGLGFVLDRTLRRETYIYLITGPSCRVEWYDRVWWGWRDHSNIGEEPVTGPDPVALARKLLESHGDA